MPLLEVRLAGKAQNLQYMYREQSELYRRTADKQQSAVHSDRAQQVWPGWGFVPQQQ